MILPRSHSSLSMMGHVHSKNNNFDTVPTDPVADGSAFILCDRSEDTKKQFIPFLFSVYSDLLHFEP